MKTDHAPPPPNSRTRSAAGTVRVELFAGMAATAGRRSLDLPWPGGSVADLRQAVATALPGVADLLARSAIALDDRYAADDVEVAETTTVAVIPPVSGG